jgi:hypothetical protein
MATTPSPAHDSEVPFEIVGTVPDPAWISDLVLFAARLESASWGGVGYERLVIGDIDEGPRTWMPPAGYQEWRAGHAGGRIGATGAKAFVADDGVRTAVVLPLDKRWDFLMFACHEMVEVALDRRQELEGHLFEEMTHTSLAHVLWTEYVVERTRRTIASELGWGFGEIENGHIVEQMQDIEAELPDLIQWAVQNDEPPQRITQHWYEMARVYSMALGRADAGCPADGEQLQRFVALPLSLESASGWHVLDKSLREAYERPGESAADLDQLVRDEGWGPLYQEMADFWNSRYEAALY